ncbi:outer membrane beta-barrel protein [Christiangramia aquimixticola]|uniref:outer membrane beta-barrel protein n=1 Tax=Christiangramia aquimixticola TaxID=1697558 RepID=UPI003AA9D992
MKAITNSKLVKFLFFLLLLAPDSGLIAQEEEITSTPNFSISGTVDAYFRTNFNGLNRSLVEAGDPDIIYTPAAPATAFVNDPGFAIGMANIILNYENEKVGFGADLVFGPRGEDAVFLSKSSINIVNQLYAFYKVNDALKFTLGNWNTFLGYEVISPSANFHYSTSYLFSYGPFSHTGIKADFNFTENWTGMLAIMNPTDYTEFNPIGKYSYGAQLGYSNSNGSAFLNLLYGDQTMSEHSLFQIDLTTGWDLTETFCFGFNGSYQATNGSGFYGAAVYPQLSLLDKFDLGFRAEYFKERDGDTIVYNADTSVTAFTLTGSYTQGGLIIKPEFRVDTLSDDYPAFYDKDLKPGNQLSSFVLAAIYAF